MKRAMSEAAWERVKRNRDRAEERHRRESEIATCECGAPVRKGPQGWVHVGPCRV